MNVLIACKESQAVCKAFRERGHNAFSCDLKPCTGGHPEWHIQGDVLPLLEQKWDLIIAHPPCTYMSKAGARWMYPTAGNISQERLAKAVKAKEFFLKILNADCDRIAIENPRPLKVVELPKPSQVIQPYQFGHPYSKATCLWLKGLPPLEPTEVLTEYKPYCPSNTGGVTRGQSYNKGGAIRAADDCVNRSKTFDGIAKAMAEQWG